MEWLWWCGSAILLLAYRHGFSLDNYWPGTVILTAIDLAVLFVCAWVVDRVCMPVFLARDRRVLFTLSLAALIGAGSLTQQALQLAWYRGVVSLGQQELEILSLSTYQVFNSYMVIAVGCVGTLAYRSVVDNRSATRQLKALEQERSAAELAFLRAQTDPHFLFNTLNSIFAAIDPDNTQARRLVIEFGELLRFQLYECKAERIPVQREWECVQGYARLQQSRMDPAPVLHLEAKGDITHTLIPPLLLLPFVENAFKFAAAGSDGEIRIRIGLELDDGGSSFHCVNTVGPAAPQPLVHGGIGLANTRRRLELLYPDRHTLRTGAADGQFVVELRIQGP